MTSHLLDSFLSNLLSFRLSSEIVSAVLILFVASRVKKLVDGLRAVHHLPGMRVPFQPLEFPAVLIPTTWWNPGVQFTWKWRHTFYKTYGSESVSIVPFIRGRSSVYTSNMDVARQALAGGNRNNFGKPWGSVNSLLVFGMNVLAADGDMWRKHRRIMGPAFNNNLYQSVWDEAIDVYGQMMSGEGWTTEKVVEAPAVQTLTFKVAFLLISRCGFGFPADWSSPPIAPDGSMTVQEALRLFTQHQDLLIAAPKWVLSLPFQKMREARGAYEALLRFMKAEVVARKALIRGDAEWANGRTDTFTMLVKANEDESGKYRLDDDELIGNIHILLFAGHETTAQTLAATLGFLSLHDDVQDEVYEQIISVVGQDGVPDFHDYTKLDKVVAVFYEATRMFPAGFLVIREANEDTVLQIPNPPGEEGSTALPIEKGTQVILDMVGVQNNPRYFDEPEKYKPSRWYGISNESEAFSAFSVGSRACIGRKFATTEAAAFLTVLLRDWKVAPILEGGETKEQWRGRVLDAHFSMSLGVKDVPLRFIRRERQM